MVRDAAATRQRILQASWREFAAVGFAGARIDRIAAAADVNKRMLYVYFGDKDGLFDAALDHVIGAMVERVPLGDGSLADYAVRLFDYLGEHPEALRLSMWRQLERPSGGPSMRLLYANKLHDMRAAGSDALRGADPFDVLVLVNGMASAWATTPQELLAATESPADRDRHRTTLRAAVASIESSTFRPGPD